MSLSLFLEHMSIAGALTLLVLVGTSVFVAALGRELTLRSRHLGMKGDWLLAQVHYLLVDRAVGNETARIYLDALDRPLARILREMLFLESPDLERGDYLLSTLVDRERARLEGGLSSLGTVAVIAPFIGLFGTVLGITKTFADVAKLGKAGIEVVSAGVSEALVATGIGLVVAIVSVVLFNAFKARFDREVGGWDTTARALLTLLTNPTTATKKGDGLFGSAMAAHSTESAEAFLLANPKLS